MEDGINPATSVTAEWNIELSKYLQNIRQSRSSNIPSLMASFDQPGSKYSGGEFPISSGDTLFTYGLGKGNTGQARSSIQKRSSGHQSDNYAKRSRFEQPLVETFGGQPENVSNKLAAGVLKFIAENLDEKSMDRSTRAEFALDTPHFSSHKRSYGMGVDQSIGQGFSSNFSHSTRQDGMHDMRNSGMGRDKFPQYGNRSSAYPASNQFGSVGSFSGSQKSIGFDSFSKRVRGKRNKNKAKQLAGLSQDLNPHRKSTVLNSDKSKVSPLVQSNGKQSMVPSKLNSSSQSAGGEGFSEDTLFIDRPTINQSTVQEETLPDTEPTGSKADVSVIKPRSIKDRLDISTNKKAPVFGDPGRDTPPVTNLPVQNVRTVTPLINSAGPRRVSVKARLNIGSPNKYLNPGLQASDEFLLNAPTGGHQQNRPLLVEPRDFNPQRHVELQYAPFNGPFPHGGKVAPQFRLGQTPSRPAADVATNRLIGAPKGIPNMLLSLKTSNDPTFNVDKHTKRSDYILMAVKPSDYHTRLCRIIADYNHLENDKMHLVKIGNRRFAAFDKTQQLSDKSIVPSVAFLKTNQWDPGFEKSTAPMTALQKEVAGFNTALYQLMKMRKKLEKQLRLGKDASITVAKEKCVTPYTKLRQLLPDEPSNTQADEQSVSCTATDTKTEEKGDVKEVDGENPVIENVTDAKPSEVDENMPSFKSIPDNESNDELSKNEENVCDPTEQDEKLDDWTDFDNSNIEIGVSGDSVEGPTLFDLTRSPTAEMQVPERIAQQEADDSNSNADVQRVTSTDDEAMAKCFDVGADEVNVIQLQSGDPNELDSDAVKYAAGGLPDEKMLTDSAAGDNDLNEKPLQAQSPNGVVEVVKDDLDDKQISDTSSNKAMEPSCDAEKKLEGIVETSLNDDVKPVESTTIKTVTDNPSPTRRTRSQVAKSAK